MRHAEVDLHNVAELTETDGAKGRRLDRLPASVRAEVNENAREMYTWAAGTEIRWVADSPASVTLSCPTGECEAVPHYGSFAADPEEWVTLDSKPTTLELETPPGLLDVDDDRRAAMPFDPRVVRVRLQGQPAHIHDISGPVRPPSERDLPDRTLLAYGTSITQGLLASRGHATYAAQTARRIGTDLVNLGTSGSAHCEAAIADHIAGRKDWDLAVLSVSVNMLANGFTTAEFRERAMTLVETVADAHPDSPVACITLFPLFTDIRSEPEPEEWPGKTEAYRRALREVVAETDHENVHLFEGPALLPDAVGLSPDLVHPSDHGMAQIGERLAARLDSLG